MNAACQTCFGSMLIHELLEVWLVANYVVMRSHDDTLLGNQMYELIQYRSTCIYQQWSPDLRGSVQAVLAVCATAAAGL
jgi:hypothetical protein